MSSDGTKQPEDDLRPAPRRHGLIALSLAGLVAGMVGLSFAAVPLYRIFCQATGYNGTPGRANAAPDASQVLDQTIHVRFDANVAPGLPWDFEPVQKNMQIRVGASNLAFFRATNHSDQPVTGTAVFNVAPNNAAQYFDKVQCFCFTKQTLKPGESVEMPVTFFVEPDFVKDESTKHIRDITLSYTFYRNDESKGVAAAPAGEAKDNSGS